MAKKVLLADPVVMEPCPFCGAELVGKDEFWRNKTTGISRMYTVYSHPQRGCILDLRRFHFYAEPWKVDAWNKRVKIG